MIKLIADTQVVLGLSHENLDRLRAGEPIDTGRIEGHNISIILFAGETEESMARDVQSLIGPETKIRAYPGRMGMNKTRTRRKR